MNKHKSYIAIPLILSMLLISCSNNEPDFSSYTPSTSYCTSNLHSTSNGFNRVCSLNKVLTSSNVSINPFDSDLIYSQFPLRELTYEKVAAIETIMGPSMISLHKDFDRHYYYNDENGNVINNLRTINESYGTGQSVQVSSDLIDILSLSLELSDKSDGSFNIALGELSEYWNNLINENNNDDFYYHDPDYVESDGSQSEENKKLKEELELLVSQIPTPEELKEILIINKDNNTVTFNKFKDVEKVSLTLGGIGKGYAVGKVADQLVAQGYTYGFLTGASSSNVTLGKRHDNNPWTIAITAPSKYDFDVGGYLSLDGFYQISTSGDTVNSYSVPINNHFVLRHHIIDPISGYPQNYYRKVSIVSKTLSSATMDALSTILMNTPTSKIKDTIELFREYYSADLEAIFQLTDENESTYTYNITKGLKDAFSINESNTHLYEVNYYDF